MTNPSEAQRVERLSALSRQVSACRRCVDAGYIPTADPVGGARGRVSDRLMLIGQAPGRLSVARGMPFGGPGGEVLDDWLTRAGYPPNFLRTGVYLTALTRCFPGKVSGGKGDRAPSAAEMALCRPYLDAELALVDPELIVLVGGLAIRVMLGTGPLEHWVGQMVEQSGRHWLPLPHPSGVSRWLNAPAHRLLVDRALDQLAKWREERQ